LFGKKGRGEPISNSSFPRGEEKKRRGEYREAKGRDRKEATSGAKEKRRERGENGSPHRLDHERGEKKRRGGMLLLGKKEDTRHEEKKRRGLSLLLRERERNKTQFADLVDRSRVKIGGGRRSFL